MIRCWSSLQELTQNDVGDQSALQTLRAVALTTENSFSGIHQQPGLDLCIPKPYPTSVRLFHFPQDYHVYKHK